jgi:tetratricopeptide (TPR) repeat protein
MTASRNEKDLKKIEKAYDGGWLAYAAALGRAYVATHPEDAEGWWFRGSALYDLDEYAEASRALETAVPLAAPPFLAQILATLGHMSRDLGNVAQAERFYQQAIEAAPDEADHYLDYCQWLQWLERHEEAEAWLRKGLDAGAAPAVNLRVRLGNLMMARGDLLGAFETIHKGLEKAPWDTEIETSMKDLEQLARLKGIQLPHVKSSPEVEDEEHVPGHLTANLHREFFADIAAGRKKIEYREATEYWQKRIDKAGRPPFHFRLINGMNKKAPELTVVVEKVVYNVWDEVYEFHLGKILEIKNWDKERMKDEG